MELDQKLVSAHGRLHLSFLRNMDVSLEEPQLPHVFKAACSCQSVRMHTNGACTAACTQCNDALCRKALWHRAGRPPISREPAAPDTTFYVLRIGHVPYTDAQWQNPAWCQNIENRIAAVRGQIFGISNAAAALYDVIEEYSDDFPEMLQKEQMEQLNIIKGNCCKLMRPSLCCQEISKYYQKLTFLRKLFFGP